MYSRLDQHAEKGKEDGLYISCVASSRNLWAVIMDAGTGFTSKFCELSPEWILEQWDKNYITSFAGASNGSALVVYVQGENSKGDLFSVLALSLVLERRKILRTN
ncbi:hypothetical protein ACSBR1_041493 [Camellia fascicularis]